MERTNRAVTSRKNRTNAGNVRGMYVDGNAARRLQEVPARKYQTSGVQTAKRVREERAAEKSRQLSREAQRNREKAQRTARKVEVSLCFLLWYMLGIIRQMKYNVKLNVSKEINCESSKTSIL